jgi:enamine deaminase RidA (YjgF/YER057c/UK114 family)
MSNAAIAREDRPGLRVTTVRRASAEEQYLTLWPLEGEPSEALFERFAQWLRESGARVLKQTVFGSLATSGRGMATLEAAYGPVDWPVTWIDGAACDGRPIAGFHAHLVRGVSVETLRLGGDPVGRVYEDGRALYCVLGNLHADEVSAPAPVQARRLFVNLEAALALVGMRCTDIARTWLYLDRILDWYHDFNPVRTRFFSERGLFESLVPASTGIGGANPAGAAILAEAYALQSAGPDVTVVEVPSPLQCPAPSYGSAFSRAVEIAAAGVRHLLISGTASIEPGGKTAHPYDTPAQVERAMQVVRAILESRGMGFADVSRAVAYFRNASEAPLFARYCAREGIPPLPVIIARDDICRDDLLFEIELDAVAEA